MEGEGLEPLVSPDWGLDDWFLSSKVKIDGHEHFRLTKAQEKAQFSPAIQWRSQDVAVAGAHIYSAAKF